MANAIVLENQKQGNPVSEWGIDGDGDGNIQGFATQISTNAGATVDFKIATDSTNYRIDIYRLGYYGGDGARKVATVNVDLAEAQVQPHPIVDMSRGLIDCGNWAVSANWQIPQDAVSGVYIAKLVREDGTAGVSHIPFIVRDDGSTSDIVFQTSDTTWQAYNAWGGASLYYGEVPTDPNDMIGYMPPNCSCGLTAIGRATSVSYNRPIITNTSPIGGTHDFIFGVEHSAIRWLEQNGYDVSYISGVDATRDGQKLLDHKAFLSVGHDEYWSAEQRANVEAARDAGVNLAFWSGNEVYWKIRWEDSIDGNGTPYRTLVCYKETWSNSSTDPSDIGTGTWRDPRYADPGQEPENSLTGTMFTVDSYRLDTMTVPYEFSNLRFWRNTEIANLQPGQTHSLVQNLLGYEWDSDVENGYRPDGLINMSSSTVSVDSYLRDYGSTIGSADVTHSLTMYRAPSGALVFGAGTVFWSWGLDDQHEGAATPTDPNVQQSMVNMFADMGIQPETLQASLVLATQSTDFTKPVSTITSPTVGASFVEGQRVTVTGTAQDLGGGVIAAVEISLDGGQSWWKTQGRENWSYSWNVQGAGTYEVMTRAVDDSLNLETPTSSVEVTVGMPETTSLWSMNTKPTEETILDRDPVELGVRFTSTIAGEIEGIRFYKGFYNQGAHPVSLWSADGTLLATATTTGESIKGWQTALFDTPVQIQSNTTYVASYHSTGFYSWTADYFAQPYSLGPLRVGQGGAVYSYGPGQFPSLTSNYNYHVDVIFDAGPNTQPIANDDSGFAVFQDAQFSISASTLLANDTDPDGDALSVTGVGNATNGTVQLSNGTVTFTPAAGFQGEATFTYTISDGRNGVDEGTVTLSVEDWPEGVGLFEPDQGATASVYNENTGLELGTKFVAANPGEITGIRYYRSAGDNGPHTGSIWAADGTLLAQVTFANQTDSGWQTAKFETPIIIDGGTTYVASYHTDGSYIASSGFFNQTYTNGSLTAPASSDVGGNGVYRYSSNIEFPTQTYNAANYWVDVVYKEYHVNKVPIAVNDNGFAVSYNGSLAIASATLLANDSDADGDPLTITGVSNASGGTASLDQNTGQVTFTAANGYVGPAAFTYTVEDGNGGVANGQVELSVSQPEGSVNLFSSSSGPSIASVNDSGSVELGVRFTTDTAGQILGIRYYKSANDVGTHTGTLWTSTGTQLASATFTNETTTGWQTVTFSQPVDVSAGTSYVASYHSNGFYGTTPDYFGSAHTSGPLTAPAGQNGVYAYSSGTTFPTASYAASNYWVDVIFRPATENIAPVAAADSGYSTSYQTDLVINGSSLLANDTDADGDPLTITGVGNAANCSVVFDSQNNSVTFTPNAGYSGVASFDYTISDGQGGTSTAQVSVEVLAAGDEQNLFGNATPTLTAIQDSPVNLGMKFEADVAGWITGMRFYKSDAEGGTHQARLWTATGTLLATATFTNESSSGWQSVALDTPVAIDAATTYVVSYNANQAYVGTGGFFSQDHVNDNLRALSSALSGGNGVYGYGASGVFPTDSYNQTNYYVDVAFRPQLAA